MKINAWHPYNYTQRKTVRSPLKTVSLSFDKRNQKQETERKLNLSMINANKYTFLSTREVMMAVYSPSYLFFFFRVFVDRGGP